jgi:hypothetical protein
MPTAEKVPEPVQMLQLLAGFQTAQALYVVAKLGLATALADGPRTIGQLAAATGADADALQRIVRALAPMGIFVTDEDTVQATPLGATLAEGHPGSVRDMALFWMETHYAPFGEFLHTAMTGENAANYHYGEPFFDWITQFPSLVEIQNRAMAAVTAGLRAGMFDNYTAGRTARRRHRRRRRIHDLPAPGTRAGPARHRLRPARGSSGSTQGPSRLRAGQAGGVRGGAADVREAVAAFGHLGADELIFNPALDDPGEVARLADAVL